MGMLTHLFYPWGLILQAAAIIHFIRRRPETYWLYVILFLGPLGALVYLVMEALPDVGLLGHSVRGFSRRKRISQLEIAVLDNPSAGNFEEIGDLYLDEGKFLKARAAYDRAIAARSYSDDCYYRRGICALKLDDAAAAIPDLERVVNKDPGYDFYRAAGLLAHAYALTGQPERAEGYFKQATDRSTSSELYLNYAEMLAAQGRNAEARVWAGKVLSKKPSMPGYLRRRERPWFRSASRILKRLPA
jgi:hypothetical protein